MRGPANPRASEELVVQRIECRCNHRSKFDLDLCEFEVRSTGAIGRTATSASEYPMVVGALAGEKTRDAARTKIPMQ